MKQRLWLMFLIAVLALGAISLLTLQYTPTPVSGGLIKLFSGMGTSDSPYIISSYNDIKTLANLMSGRFDGDSVDMYADAYYSMNCDITLQGIQQHSLLPIGTEAIPFRGSFNGNGHRIMGSIGSSNTSRKYYSLFGVVKDAAITNLQIELDVNAFSAEGENVIFAAGVASIVKGSTIISGCSYVGNMNCASSIPCVIMGGIAADVQDNTCVISDCRMLKNATIYTVADYSAYAGGIAGRNNGGINDCFSLGDISANDCSKNCTIFIGGIVGSNSYLLNSCTHGGNVYVTDVAVNIGGIAGETHGGVIKACVNTGLVDANCDNSKLIYQGGIAGRSSNTYLMNCINACDVTCIGVLANESAIGGIVGYFEIGRLVNCTNIASVLNLQNNASTSERLGGVFGASGIETVCANVAYINNNDMYGGVGRTDTLLGISSGSFIIVGTGSSSVGDKLMAFGYLCNGVTVCNVLNSSISENISYSFVGQGTNESRVLISADDNEIIAVQNAQDEFPKNVTPDVTNPRWVAVKSRLGLGNDSTEGTGNAVFKLMYDISIVVDADILVNNAKTDGIYLAKPNESLTFTYAGPDFVCWIVKSFESDALLYIEKDPVLVINATRNLRVHVSQHAITDSDMHVAAPVYPPAATPEPTHLYSTLVDENRSIANLVIVMPRRSYSSRENVICRTLCDCDVDIIVLNNEHTPRSPKTVTEVTHFSEARLTDKSSDSTFFKLPTNP